MSRRSKRHRDPVQPPRAPRGPKDTGVTDLARERRERARGSKPGLEDWRPLYAAATQVLEMAPWTWMTETEVFAVRDVESDHVGYVSIMGRMGQHLSVAVYQGGPGLAGFFYMQEMGSDGAIEEILDTPHLQASFEDRHMLEKEDLRVVRDLGLKFRGHYAWPMFRSYRPGYLPWLLETEEVRFLTLVLEQVLEMAPRVREGELSLFLDFWGGSPEQLVVRSPRLGTDGVEWSEDLEPVELPEPEEILIEMDELALARLERLPARNMALEVTFEFAPMRVHEPGKRPYAPRMLLAVEAESGFVLGSELVSPDDSPGHPLGMAPMHLVRILVRTNLRPSVVVVRSTPLAEVLSEVFAPLDIAVEESYFLPAAEEALAALSAFSRR